MFFIVMGRALKEIRYRVMGWSNMLFFGFS